jgi:hypothetical protein
MKKTYLSPETDLFYIATSKMIAVSGFEQTLKDEDPIENPDKMLSRRHNVWDDEAEEEEF